MDNYSRGGHSKYSLKIHLIFVTKYRKPIFVSESRAYSVKQFIWEACNRYGYEIIQMETDKDHVHMLIGYSPKDSVSDMVKRIKQYSTQQMWCSHGSYLSRQYWKHKILWSDGYFACSIGQVSQAVIEKYIQNQG